LLFYQNSSKRTFKQKSFEGIFEVLCRVLPSSWPSSSKSLEEILELYSNDSKFPGPPKPRIENLLYPFDEYCLSKIGKKAATARRINEWMSSTQEWQTSMLHHLFSCAIPIREHEIADVTKKPEFTPFYWKFSLFVFVSEKNIAFLISLLFVE
jgi:hypothetical protein